MGKHLRQEQGDLKFKSYKYSWCGLDFVPLKISDRRAQIPLLMLALSYKVTDPEFAEDLLTRLDVAGVKIDRRYPLLFRSVFEQEEADIPNDEYEQISKDLKDCVAKMSPGELYLWHKEITHRMYEILDGQQG